MYFFNHDQTAGEKKVEFLKTIEFSIKYFVINFISNINHITNEFVEVIITIF